LRYLHRHDALLVLRKDPGLRRDDIEFVKALRIKP